MDLLADTSQNAFIPYTLAEKGAQFGDGSTYITYRNSCIIAVLGVPGAMLGGLLVEVPKFGRKGALATSTILTGVFIYGSTTAKTSDQLLAWNCVYSFFSNVMYAVLYAYTPEVFPTKDRGTGNALAATANRVFGIMGGSTVYPSLRTRYPLIPQSCPVRHAESSQHRSSPCLPTFRRPRRCTPVAHCLLPPVWSW